MSIANSTRRRVRRKKTTYCYESPLSDFKKSLQELERVMDRICGKRLTRGMLQRLNEQDAILDNAKIQHCSKKKSLSQNSVIVISDNEIADNENEADDKKDTSQNVKEQCLPLQEENLAEQNTDKSVIQIDNNSSILSVSDTQESLNEENIAPMQMEDDVVELWSCLKKPNVKKTKTSRKTYDCYRMNKLFIIDKRPNLNYLKYLEADTKKHIKKRKKKQYLSYQKASKCLNNISRTDRYTEYLDRNCVKSNAHCNKKEIKLNKMNNQTNSSRKLREIIVDGCNVAMAHTHGNNFSERGIQIVVDYFKSKGHVVKVFLPHHVRKKKYIYLEQLYKEGIVVFTPSRTIDGRKITSYDDRFILKYATSCEGIVISTDQYRDLYREKPEWRNTILNRLLIPTFVGDCIMFPEDPLGRFGPNLETFLRY